MIEILVVIAIIAVLASAGIAAAGYVQATSRRQGTEAVIEAITARIAAHGRRDLVVTSGSAAQPIFRTFAPLFDLNTNGEIDGAPAVTGDAEHEGGFDAAIVGSGYEGAVDMLALTLPSERINRRRQPIDAWRHPLQISFHPTNFGPRGFQVWSLGKDGIAGTVDDLPRGVRP